MVWTLLSLLGWLIFRGNRQKKRGTTGKIFGKKIEKKCGRLGEGKFFGGWPKIVWQPKLSLNWPAKRCFVNFDKKTTKHPSKKLAEKQRRYRKKKTSSRNLKKWFRKLSTFSCPCFWHLLRPRWLCSEYTSQVPYLGSPLIPPLVAGSPLFGTCSGWKKNNPAKLLETFTLPPRIFYNFWCPFFAQKKDVPATPGVDIQPYIRWSLVNMGLPNPWFTVAKIITTWPRGPLLMLHGLADPKI